MDTLTVKIPDHLKAKLRAYSKQKGLSRSEIVRAALLEYLKKDTFQDKNTFYDLAKDLAGSVKDAPPNLSVNKKHLDGYGK